MWIRSQNKEIIIDANSFYIHYGCGKKYNIYTSANINSEDDLIIASYDTKEEAIEQFNKIHWALQNMKINVFQVK